MANILLKPDGTETALIFPDTTPAQGSRQSTQIIDLAADDIISHPDEIVVMIEANSGTAGEALNVFVAMGEHTGGFDGIITPSSTVVTASQLANLGVPRILLMDGAALIRKSFIFRVPKARVIVCIESLSTIGVTALAGTVRAYNYESV